VQYDLGAEQSVAGATFVWYAARGAQCPYAVALSRDGVTFTDAYTGVLAGRGTRTCACSFTGQTARFVRVRFDALSSSRAPSIYEVAVQAVAPEQRASAR
jgi:hypothetical protein